MSLIYNVALHLVLPVMFVRMLWRSRRLPEHRQGWSQRLGFFPSDVESGGVWVHAVSLGETIAAEPLIKKLHQEQPSLPLVVTSTTATGFQRTAKQLSSMVKHSYVPFDTTWAIKRFLNKVQPKVLVIMEKELWPNIIKLCVQRDIKIVVANACLSDRSLRGYQRLPWLSTPMVQGLDWVSAQTQKDYERFLALGVSPDKVAVSGSIKFDLTVSPVLREQALAFKPLLCGRKVILASSTHEGEEQLISDVFCSLSAKWESLLLIIVPRHPERFDSVAQYLNRHYDEGQWRRRSLNQEINNDTLVYLADTMGELLMWYICADIAIVGGSFVPVGGHNPIEASAVSCPVIMGPYTNNCHDIVLQLEQAGGLRQVDGHTMLAETLQEWLSNPALAKRSGELGEAAVEVSKGAIETISATIKRFLL